MKSFVEGQNCCCCSLHELNENTAPWSSSVLKWLKAFILKTVGELATESDWSPSPERTLYTVEELSNILPGAPLHADTIRRCIRKHKLKCQGVGFRGAKLYSVMQFEEVFVREAQASHSKIERYQPSSSPFGRVQARRKSHRKAS